MLAVFMTGMAFSNFATANQSIDEKARSEQRGALATTMAATTFVGMVNGSLFGPAGAAVGAAYGLTIGGALALKVAANWFDTPKQKSDEKKGIVIFDGKTKTYARQ